MTMGAAAGGAAVGGWYPAEQAEVRRMAAYTCLNLATGKWVRGQRPNWGLGRAEPAPSVSASAHFSVAARTGAAAGTEGVFVSSSARPVALRDLNPKSAFSPARPAGRGGIVMPSHGVGRAAGGTRAGPER